MRGSRTNGYGRIGQHRDHGSKGFRKVGRHKHLWSYVSTYEPDYFGKHGFTSPQKVKRETNVINLQKLESLAQKQAVKSTDGKLAIDLKNLGYTKLLGSGRVSSAITVSVDSCSRSAAQKIEAAGGEVIIPGQETGE